MAVKNFQWIKMPFIRFEIRFHLNTVAEMVYYTKHMHLVDFLVDLVAIFWFR